MAGIIATDNGGGKDFQKAPEGTHIARCVQMIQLGTIEKDFMGDKKRVNEVRITWELPNELTVFDSEKGEEPFVISETYTLSTGEKANLRKVIDAWRGKPLTEAEAKEFDVTVLLGKPCMINIGYRTSKSNGKEYANITSVMALPKGTSVPDQITPTKLLSFAEFDWNLFESLSNYVKDRIANSLEYGQLMADKVARESANAGKTHAAPQAIAPATNDDDLPL
jgi:hypothetical protein